MDTIQVLKDAEKRARALLDLANDARALGYDVDAVLEAVAVTPGLEDMTYPEWLDVVLKIRTGLHRG